jgi:hypothetical protein|nr:MAG TPA: hypothetical protein [Microviridae sp.]
MVTRVLAAGQEDEEIRKSEILCLNEQNTSCHLMLLSLKINSKRKKWQ